MVWQEYIFSIGSWIFVFALIPAIRAKAKPPRWGTCGLTMMVLWMFVIAFATLGLYLSAASTALTASAWTILFVQKR